LVTPPPHNVLRQVKLAQNSPNLAPKKIKKSPKKSPKKNKKIKKKFNTVKLNEWRRRKGKATAKGIWLGLGGSHTVFEKKRCLLCPYFAYSLAWVISQTKL
jgi:hypothetical protein